ncbi:two pore domain potassium channel family protein [Cyclobacteriaceae bacterium YHN15]|nr:two pore domain potassium channel family protein [Cyclobacteriaceae bacterium YHN15]
MKKTFTQIKDYWLSDASFLTLLIMLIFIVFVMPVLIDLGYDSILFLNIMFIALFFTGIFSAKENILIVLTTTLFFAHVVLKLIRLSDSPYEYYFWERIVGLLNLLVFIFINMRLLFRNEEINLYRVIGAINVYLLIALFGAFLFEIITIFYGDSIIGDIKLRNDDEDYAYYIYYSLVSLTTVGYGDIYPSNMASRMVSVFLSATGILYPAVVIAKLVASASLKQKKD